MGVATYNNVGFIRMKRNKTKEGFYNIQRIKNYHPQLKNIVILMVFLQDIIIII